MPEWAKSAVPERKQDNVAVLTEDDPVPAPRAFVAETTPEEEVKEISNPPDKPLNFKLTRSTNNFAADLAAEAEAE